MIESWGETSRSKFFVTNMRCAENKVNQNIFIITTLRTFTVHEFIKSEIK